jgi:hypothetical protein
MPWACSLAAASFSFAGSAAAAASFAGTRSTALFFLRCAKPRTAGFTLVECLAALTTAATCLTALLIARSAAVNQAHRTAAVAAAVDYAGRLATDVALEGVTRAGVTVGSVDQPRRLHYRRTCQLLPVNDELQMWQVRIEVFGQTDEQPLCDAVLWLPSVASEEGDDRGQ